MQEVAGQGGKHGHRHGGKVGAGQGGVQQDQAWWAGGRGACGGESGAADGEGAVPCCRVAAGAQRWHQSRPAAADQAADEHVGPPAHPAGARRGTPPGQQPAGQHPPGQRASQRLPRGRRSTSPPPLRRLRNGWQSTACRPGTTASAARAGRGAVLVGQGGELPAGACCTLRSRNTHATRPGWLPRAGRPMPQSQGLPT